MSYVNGSDLLLEIAGKCVGHCTSHSCDYTAETKSRAVKPVATASADSGLWEDKSVNKLSIAISFEGLRNYEETEGGFKTLLAAWHAHQPVQVKAYERSKGETPYLVGNFIITSLKETNGAGDDATYSGNLENTGQPTTFAPAKLTGEGSASTGDD